MSEREQLRIYKQSICGPLHYKRKVTHIYNTKHFCISNKLGVVDPLVNERENQWNTNTNLDVCLVRPILQQQTSTTTFFDIIQVCQNNFEGSLVRMRHLPVHLWYYYFHAVEIGVMSRLMKLPDNQKDAQSVSSSHHHI